MQSLLNDELRNYDMWLKCGKLSFNIKKTDCVIFKPRQRIANDDFNIFFGITKTNKRNQISGCLS